jgi:hypothetical protein
MVGMLRLFVLLTTENYPGVMFPAYRVTQSSFSFFGIFVVAGTFFIVPMQLTVVMVIALCFRLTLFRMHFGRRQKVS